MTFQQSNTLLRIYVFITWYRICSLHKYLPRKLIFLSLEIFRNMCYRVHQEEKQTNKIFPAIGNVSLRMPSPHGSQHGGEWGIHECFSILIYQLNKLFITPEFRNEDFLQGNFLQCYFHYFLDGTAPLKVDTVSGNLSFVKHYFHYALF